MKKKTRIVIVDDNREFCENLREFLSANDKYEVVGTAYDGKMGYDMVLETKPDLLLTDIVMPVMDGLTLMSRIAGNTILHIQATADTAFFINDNHNNLSFLNFVWLYCTIFHAMFQCREYQHIKNLPPITQQEAVTL